MTKCDVVKYIICFMFNIMTLAMYNPYAASVFDAIENQYIYLYPYNSTVFAHISGFS